VAEGAATAPSGGAVDDEAPLPKSNEDDETERFGAPPKEKLAVPDGSRLKLGGWTGAAGDVVEPKEKGAGALDDDDDVDGEKPNRPPDLGASAAVDLSGAAAAGAGGVARTDERNAPALDPEAAFAGVSLSAAGAGENEKPGAGLAGDADAVELAPPNEKPVADLAGVDDSPFFDGSALAATGFDPPKVKPPPPPPLDGKPPKGEAAAGLSPAEASTFLPPNEKPPVLAKTGAFGGSGATALADEGVGGAGAFGGGLVVEVLGVACEFNEPVFPTSSARFVS
jgi:hypothetical protein